MNNHGWGLQEMIILCCILGGFLILVVVASKKYYLKNKSLVMITSDELLLEDYITISKLTPLNGTEPCIGYVNVIDEKTFDSYISCEEYETEGY